MYFNENVNSMKKIPLREFSKPRILTLDFTKNEIAEIERAGFQIKNAFSGIKDNKFCMPCAYQDVEIAIVKLSQDTYKDFKDRNMHDDSVYDEFHLLSLIHEIWEKGGWTIVLLSENARPEDLGNLGIENIGLLNDYGHYISPTGDHRFKTKYFPNFVGESIQLNDNLEGIFKRFINTPKWKMLAQQKCIKFMGMLVDQEWLITDDSSVPFALAVYLVHSIPKLSNKSSTINGARRQTSITIPKYFVSGILIFPDFLKKNIDVLLSLINEIIYRLNPALFSEQQREWLVKYRPTPIRKLEEDICILESDFKKKLERLQEQIQKEEIKYAWMDYLIVGKDEVFKEAVGEALKNLGYSVIDIDEKLSLDSKKREDFNITDPENSSFYIVEAKSTKRGAGEEFIHKVHTHQLNYSRKNNSSPPKAMLIINHSYQLEPSMRKSRFYTDTDVLERLKEQEIIAIDSIDLHDLCQKVIRNDINMDDARKELIKMD